MKLRFLVYLASSLCFKLHPRSGLVLHSQGCAIPCLYDSSKHPSSSQLAGSYRAETVRSRRRFQGKKCPFWKKGHLEWRFTASQNLQLPRLPPGAETQAAAPAWADASVTCSSASVPSCSRSARCCQWNASTPQTAAPQYRKWTLSGRRGERPLNTELLQLID